MTAVPDPVERLAPDAAAALAAGATPRGDSPCISICTLDDVSGYCRGCARTMDEITEWRTLSPAARGAVWQVMPARFSAMGQTTRQLAWDGQSLARFVADSLAPGAGTWLLGCYGAVAEFLVSPGEPLTRRVEGDRFVAATPRARLSLTLGPRIRAYSFADGATTPGQAAGGRVILAKLRARVRAQPATALTPLGPDTAAIVPGDRDQRLYDLGLGRPHMRYAVRTGDDDLIARLEAAAGTPWPDWMGEVGDAIVAAGPARVIETPLGRAEILTPIPPPNGRSPDGPHTHLLPAFLAENRDLPPGHDLPDACALGGIFYPAR